MVQILPEEEGFGSQLGQGLGAGLGSGFSHGINQAMQFAQKVALEKQKGQMRQKSDDTQKFGTGLEIIGAMRDIAGRKNIGRGSSVLGFFPGQTAKDRAEFAQLGTSLIPLVAAGVPIRNQKEFEQYRKIITDPSSPLSEIEGALSGLERIFQYKLNGHEESEFEEMSKEKKSKFSQSNPEHKAKAQQLYKKLGDKEKVREALRKEFEGV